MIATQYLHCDFSEDYSIDWCGGIDQYLLAHFKSLTSVYIFGGGYPHWGSTGGYSKYILKWNYTQNTSTFFVKLDTKLPNWAFVSATTNVVVIDDLNLAYFYGIDSSIAYVFNPINETIMNHNQANIEMPPYNRWDGCLTTNQSHIFMLGGQFGTNYLQIYDIQNNSWYTEPFPFIHKNYHDQYCDIVNNTLYAIGGRSCNDTYCNSGYQYHKQIYKYEWDSGWEFITNLSNSVCCGAIVHDHNDIIYILGGVGSKSSVHVFDTNNEIITGSYDILLEEVALMSAVVLPNDTIWIFGGQVMTIEYYKKVMVCSIMNNSYDPTLSPTTDPTARPTLHPSRGPTDSPTLRPTHFPSPSPTKSTISPTRIPTVDTINPKFEH